MIARFCCYFPVSRSPLIHSEWFIGEVDHAAKNHVKKFWVNQGSKNISCNYELYETRTFALLIPLNFECKILNIR